MPAGRGKKSMFSDGIKRHINYTPEQVTSPGVADLQKIGPHVFLYVYTFVMVFLCLNLCFYPFFFEREKERDG